MKLNLHELWGKGPEINVSALIKNCAVVDSRNDETII